MWAERLSQSACSSAFLGEFFGIVSESGESTGYGIAISRRTQDGSIAKHVALWGCV